MVSRIANLAIRTLAVPGIRDTQNGFKIFSRRAFTAIAPYLTIDRWGFDVEMLLVARRRGFRIIEFPITWRNSSDSRLQLGRDLRRTSADFARILSNRLRGRYPRAERD
jgi:dolichyl-phosphate beta-glucosyltransferase